MQLSIVQLQYVCLSLCVYVHNVICICTHIYVCNTDGRSVVSTTSVISNPDDLMDTYSVIITCEISPTSNAEYCEMFAGSGDTTLTGT